MPTMRDHDARSGGDVARSTDVALYAKQYDAMFDPRRIVLIEAASKCGKTFSAEFWLFKRAMEGHPGRRYTWLAPSYSQAEMAQAEMWDFFASAFEPVGAKQKQNLITLPGERTVHFKTGEIPDKLYGPGNHGVVVDEASRVRDAAIQAIYSTTLKTRGPMRLIGNVRGRHNLHYQWSRKAEAGEPGFGYFRLTADDAIAGGVFSQADIDTARRALPHAVFRELYYCEPADDGANPFGVDSIAKAIERQGGVLAPGPSRIFGVDVARTRDWTVIVGLNGNRDVCVFERFHGGSWGSIGERIAAVCNGTPGFVDSTGAGDAIFEPIQRLWPQARPFVFSNASKQGLMEGLAVGLQGGRVGLVDGVLRSEMEAFEYSSSHAGGRHVVRYEAPPGAHDDAVCALALAWHGAEVYGVAPSAGAGLVSAVPIARGAGAASSRSRRMTY